MKIYTEQELDIRNIGLIKISDILDNLQINNFLFLGVLLGAIREKNFIKWDWDVEIGCFSQELIEKKDEIFNQLKMNNLQYELVDSTFQNFKINVFYEKNKYSLWGMYFEKEYLKRTYYKFPKKHFIKFDKLLFKSRYYKIPSQSEELLEFIYDDWKIPKKSKDEKVYLSKKIHIRKSIIYRIFKKLNDKIKSKKSSL